MSDEHDDEECGRCADITALYEAFHPENDGIDYDSVSAILGRILAVVSVTAALEAGPEAGDRVVSVFADAFGATTRNALPGVTRDGLNGTPTRH